MQPVERVPEVVGFLVLPDPTQRLGSEHCIRISMCERKVHAEAIVEQRLAGPTPFIEIWVRVADDIG